MARRPLLSTKFKAQKHTLKEDEIMVIIRTIHAVITKTRFAMDSVQAIIGAAWLWLMTFAASFLACEIVAVLRYAYTSTYYAYKQVRIEQSLGHDLGEPLVVISFFSEYFVPAIGWALGLTLLVFVVVAFSRESAKTMRAVL
jgi:hypothetical protein